jgi:hypothetical protein
MYIGRNLIFIHGEDNMGWRGFTDVGTDRPVKSSLIRATSIFMPNLKWSPWNTRFYNLRSAVRSSHPASWLQWWGLWLVFFRRHRVRILSGTSAILTEAIRTFPQPFPCNCRDGTSIRQRPLPFQSFPVYSVIRSSIFCILASSWSYSPRDRRLRLVFWIVPGSNLDYDTDCIDWRTFLVFVDAFKKIALPSWSHSRHGCLCAFILCMYCSVYR